MPSPCLQVSRVQLPALHHEVYRQMQIHGANSHSINWIPDWSLWTQHGRHLENWLWKDLGLFASVYASHSSSGLIRSPDQMNKLSFRSRSVEETAQSPLFFCQLENLPNKWSKFLGTSSRVPISTRPVFLVVPQRDPKSVTSRRALKLSSPLLVGFLTFWKLARPI